MCNLRLKYVSLEVSRSCIMILNVWMVIFFGSNSLYKHASKMAIVVKSRSGPISISLSCSLSRSDIGGITGLPKKTRDETCQDSSLHHDAVHHVSLSMNTLLQTCTHSPHTLANIAAVVMLAACECLDKTSPWVPTSQWHFVGFT